jgi:UPF0042 nucleotide-binding protein
VLRALEDQGYFCIDNLPAALMVPFADLCDERTDVNRIAIGIDVRSQKFLEGVESALVELDRRLYQVEIVFLDASDAVLMRRYSETRRPHPLAPYGDVLTGISEERNITKGLRERADWILDTSRLDVHELRRIVRRDWASGAGQQPRRMQVRIQSFGYKYGIPIDSDLVLDARFLPNPYFVEELRPLSGEDPQVSDYVLSRPEAKGFLEDAAGMLERLIPLYEHEGKSYLTLSIGCTGGRHRSVAIARALADRLRIEPGAEVSHRDLDRDE